MLVKFDKNLNENAKSSCNSGILYFEEQKGQLDILVPVSKA